MAVSASFAGTTNYSYDNMLRLIKAEYEDGTVVEYVYDNLGNRLQKTTSLSGAPVNNPPNTATNPNPTDGAINMISTPTLNWTGGGDPDAGDEVVYYVYFGTPGNLSLVSSGPQTTYETGQLNSLTTYCWKVISRDNHNTDTTGVEWCFTTKNDPPVASFSATPTSGFAPLTVVFFDDSISYGDEIVSWAWDFNNDGIVDSNEQDPNYTYTAEGTYTVSLTVTDAYGSTHTETKAGYIAVAPEDPDNDLIPSSSDNCPYNYNPEQFDMDGDGTGDVCDSDMDGDGYNNNLDNCPALNNPDQADSDTDGYGDACMVSHCVTNSAELQNALTTAQSNGKDDIIKLVQGTYGISENNNQQFNYSSTERYSLLIKGGYTDSTCSSRALDPANTIIDGEHIDMWEILHLGNNVDTDYNNIIIEGITVQNGDGGFSVSTNRSGIIVANTVVYGNTGQAFVGLKTSSGRGTTTISNTIVSGNSSDFNSGIRAISQGVVNIINNTVTGNSSNGGESAIGGIKADIRGSSAQANIYNNIVWGNAAPVNINTINFEGGAIYVYNNNFEPEKFFYTNSITEGGNINVDPMFADAANGDYHLTYGSPVIDSGNNSAPSLPSIDIDGNIRIRGTAVDIGADEFSYIIRAGATSNGGIISPSGNVDIDSGLSQTFTIIPGEGYHISDVLVDGVPIGAVTEYTFSNVTANHTIEVIFEINSYTITASAAPNGNISPSGYVLINHGSDQTFVITPDEGYHVADVLVDGASIGTAPSFTFSNATMNGHTIEAFFELNSYITTAGSGPNGSIYPSGNISAGHGSNLTFTIAAEAGYRVSNVFVDGSSVGSVTSYTFTNITAGHAIEAFFAPNITYTVTAGSGSNGSISPSGTAFVYYGDNKTFTIIPDTGYRVSDVLIDGVSVGSVTTYTFSNVTANHTINAVFDLNVQFQITASAGPYGRISPSGSVQSYYGSNRTFTITADPNCLISDVFVDGVSVGVVTSYTFNNITNNHTINAVFRENWRIEVVDSGGHVGGHTSIATDSLNNVHISYYDETNMDLKYATNASGSWVSSTIDSGGNVGRNTSIAIDSLNRIHISYFDGTNKNLKYSTNMSGSWTTYTIDSNLYTGIYPDIAIDSEDHVHISYIDYSGTDYYLKYITNSSGSWVKETIDNTGYYVSYTSIAIDSQDKVHIGYYDGTNYDLKYATNASGSWVRTTIESSGDKGMSPSIALDSLDKVHISYDDYDNYDLKYATNASGSWTLNTIDTAYIMCQTFIAIDSMDKVHISYLQCDNYSLKYATNETGSWVLKTIDDSVNPIYYPSIAIDSFDGVHISYHDHVNGTLKYATNAPIDHYTIIASAGPNGSISPSGSFLVDPGINQTFTITADANYHLLDVLVDGLSVGAVTEYTFSNIISSHTIYASFEINDLDNDGYTADVDCNDSDNTVYPGATELCDNKDNDCDGSVDEGLIRASSCGVGACVATGIETCTAGVWGGNTCTPGLPTGPDDNCNGIDENCNGTADENYIPTQTNCGVGVCAATGSLVCVNGSTQDTCQPSNLTGDDSNCNGIDENCNGTADENYSPIPTNCGQGVCASTGQLICQNSSIVDTCTPGTQEPEVCDGLDNDCDGQTDEGLLANSYYRDADGDGYGDPSISTQACALPAGYVVTNTDCNDSNPNINPGATDNNCNGVDENCNGVSDDGYVVTGTFCGAGVCRRTGQYICQSGQIVNTCTSGQPTGSDANCNGVDENCNGTEDENYIPTVADCGTYTCSSGQIICVEDSIIDSYTTLLIHADGAEGSTDFTDATDKHSITNNGSPDSNTKLLLHFNGADGSTNFIDETGKSVTANGNVQIDTAQSKFSGAGALFDGSDDYLSTPDSGDWNFSAGDFTIDFWTRWDNRTGTQYILSQATASGDEWAIRKNADNSLTIYFTDSVGAGYSGWVSTTSAVIIADNTWYHLAFVRRGSDAFIFINGAAQPLTIASNWSTAKDIAAPLLIGKISYDGNTYFNGWMDELRISKGIARWTANFSLPASEHLLNIQVLTSTVESKFGGSSAYFNNSYLSIPDSDDWNFGSGDFTIDFWVKFNSIGGSHVQLIGQQDISVSNQAWSLMWRTSNELNFEWTADGYSTKTRGCSWTPTTGTWHHISIIRNTSALYIFIDGVSQPLTGDNIGSDAIYNSTDVLVIGARHNGVNYDVGLNGYMDELRVSKGIARWTSDFTPPSAPVDSSVKLLIYADGADGATDLSDATGRHSITNNGTPDANTKLLLHASGADGATSFIDETGKTVTAVGNAQIDYAGHTITTYGNARTYSADKKFGSSSMSFDGNGDYLTVPDSEDWNFGSGDFTIDFWVRLNTLTSYQSFCQYRVDNNDYMQLYFHITDGLIFDVASGGSSVVSMSEGSVAGWSANTWYHIAVVRNGSNWALYKDGVRIKTAISSNSMPIHTNLFIGTDRGIMDHLNGYLDEFRISKGIARWTSNFTPPVTTYSADLSTKLLLHGDGADGSAVFIDDSRQYLGGMAAKFDGNGDYLSMPDSDDWNFGSGDFTIDFWVRFDTLPAMGNQIVLAAQEKDGNNYWNISFFNINNVSGEIRFRQMETSSNTISIDRSWFPSIATWYHCAIVREGNSWKWFVNGVQLGSTDTNIEAVANFTGGLTIGTLLQNGLGNYFFDGWLDEFHVSKGIAKWTGNFTPPASEYSAYNQVVTSTAQSKFGGSSAYFDNSYLTLPDSDDWNFGAGDFTIDSWVRFDTLPSSGSYMMIFSQEHVSTTNVQYLALENTGGFYRWKVTSQDTATSNEIVYSENTTISAGIWYHIALVKNGSLVKIYQNGTLLGTGSTYANDIGNFDSGLYIGAYKTGGGQTYYFDGYLDEFRVSKGIARWTSNFIPPSSPVDADNDGYTVVDGDCDDTDASLNPETLWYQDSDGDGYGNPAVAFVQCTQPAGPPSYVLNNTDYNDNDPNIYGLPVKITGTSPSYYLTLQEAYNASGNGDTIQVQAVTFNESLSINLNKTVTISGGYNGAYTTQTGKTIIQGNTSVTNGKITFENIILQ
jgi:hypothetical protein